MVTVGVFEFCGMRCQPLRRALALSEEYYEICGFSDRFSVDFI
ncbi:acetyltransferase [Vibrio cholerae]|nr:acetyltransferase [Vibrio cholerae]TQQ35792.1 acetyltransferase [Vibrio cholerae]